MDPPWGQNEAATSTEFKAESTNQQTKPMKSEAEVREAIDKLTRLGAAALLNGDANTVKRLSGIWGVMRWVIGEDNGKLQAFLDALDAKPAYDKERASR